MADEIKNPQMPLEPDPLRPSVPRHRIPFGLAEIAAGRSGTAEFERRKQAASAFDARKQAETERLEDRGSLKDQEVQAKDPSSPMSKRAQDFAIKIFKAVITPEQEEFIRGQSANDIKNFGLFKTLENMMNAKQQTDREVVKAASRPLKPKPQSAFQKTLGSEQAKVFNKQLELIPEFRTRIKGVDKMLTLTDRVITGPLAGNDQLYFAQKLSNEDAQLFENFLAKENIQKMMEFAKEAGVRAIDTRVEQENLRKSIANKNLSARSLKTVLNEMKNIMSEAVALTNSKEEWLKTHEDLRGWSPNMVLGAEQADFTQGLKF